MNENSTVEKMRRMNLKAMAGLYHQSLNRPDDKSYTTDEFLTLLIDTEWEHRQKNRIDNLIKQAGFKHAASAGNIDYQSSRNLDRNVVERLLTLQFLSNLENIIITGPTGSGKSYLAQALGNLACQMLYKTRYFITGRFFDAAKLARLDGTYVKFMNQIEKTDLLILDDFGLHSMDQTSRQILLDLIEQRHGSRSTIIGSQIPVSEWHGLIGEGTIADAILDRVVYSSHRIDLKGDSLRKKQRLN